MFDSTVSRANPVAFHLTNLWLHALNVAFLFIGLYRVSGRLIPALFVAALFAFHPVNVESVAWISERKGLLAACFGSLAFNCYLTHIARPSLARYLLICFLFILSLLSKPSTAPLPLFLAAAYALRLRNHYASRPRPRAAFLLECAPFLIFATIALLLAIYTEKQVGSASTSLPFGYRLQHAIVAYTFYIGKTIWPTALSPHYPLPNVWPPVLVVCSAVVLCLLSVLIATLSRSSTNRVIALGWLFYLILLIPAIGLIQIGSHAMANRYLYIPMIGILIAIIFPVFNRWPGSRISIGTAAAVSLLLWVRTAAHIPVWRNSQSLFTYAVSHHPSPLSYIHLGISYRNQGDGKRALDCFKKALQIRPDNPYASVNAAVCLNALGRSGEALAYLERTMVSHPGLPEAYSFAAWLLSTNPNEGHRNGNRAIALAEKAIELTETQPGVLDNPAHLRSLAAARAEVGDWIGAVESVVKAATLARSLQQFTPVAALDREYSSYMHHKPVREYGTYY